MNSQNNNPTIYMAIFKSTGLVLSMFIILVLIIVTLFIFDRYETNVKLLLQRSLVVAEKEYNGFFDRSYAQLIPLASRNPADITAYLAAEKEYDFWLLTDRQGSIIAGNAQNPPRLQQLTARFQPVWTKGQPLRSTELYPQDAVADISSALVAKGHISQYPFTLFQVTAVPRHNADGISGSIIVGRLLNNNSSIAESYSKAIKNSFLSISSGGVRIATNLTSALHSSFAGSRQAADLTAAVNRGDTYWGQVKVEADDIHFVIAVPLKNLEGQIIGALTVGVPSNGLAGFKSESAVYIFFALLFSLTFALIATSMVAKKVTQPVTGLSILAKQISDSEEIDRDHISILKNQAPAKIQEVRDLQHSFGRMAASLYQKCQENATYLQVLETERTQLQTLTLQLQEANTNLEKKVQEQTATLHQAVIELQALNSQKSKFLANMSHELRTPLNSIIGFTQMLHDEIYGKLNVTQTEYTEIILHSAQHLLEIINDILDLSLIDQNRTALIKQEVSIHELIKSVVAVVKPQAEVKNIQIFIFVDDDLPSVTVDPTRIKQVLYNLLTNAVKFTPEGGMITIKAECADLFLKVAVTDTGIGIKAEDCQRVFDEFYQVENIYQRKFAGVGLGLPLSKRLIELHGGQITLSSRLDIGTTVAFTLPASSS